MEYAKITVKNNYEKKGDLVLRSYIRALKKIKAWQFLDNDEAYIYGRIDEDGNFYELFTDLLIDYNNYEIISRNEYFDLWKLSIKEVELLSKIMSGVLFNHDVDLNFEISSIEDLADDRTIEFEAYNDCLSRINPYKRISGENIDSYNDYNNFLVKINEVNKMNAENKSDYTKTFRK